MSDKKCDYTDDVATEVPLMADEQPAALASRPIIRRPRIKHAISFKDRLSKAAQEARQQAAQLPAGEERDRLLLKARQCESAADIDQWISSPGSPPPHQLVMGNKPKR